MVYNPQQTSYSPIAKACGSPVAAWNDGGFAGQCQNENQVAAAFRRRLKMSARAHDKGSASRQQLFVGPGFHTLFAFHNIEGPAVTAVPTIVRTATGWLTKNTPARQEPCGREMKISAFLKGRALLGRSARLASLADR